jgi:hypothetical protein
VWCGAADGYGGGLQFDGTVVQGTAKEGGDAAAG